MEASLLEFVPLALAQLYLADDMKNRNRKSFFSNQTSILLLHLLNRLLAASKDIDEDLLAKQSWASSLSSSFSLFCASNPFEPFVQETITKGQQWPKKKGLIKFFNYIQVPIQPLIKPKVLNGESGVKEF